MIGVVVQEGVIAGGGMFGLSGAVAPRLEVTGVGAAVVLDLRVIVVATALGLRIEVAVVLGLSVVAVATTLGLDVVVVTAFGLDVMVFGLGLIHWPCLSFATQDLCVGGLSGVVAVSSLP